MVPVVARRHSPSAALAWLILIFFKPWLGLALYLLIGENLITRKRIKSYCKTISEVRALGALSLEQPQLFHLPEELQQLRIVNLTRRLSCMPVLGGNAVELIDNGCRAIKRIIADIDAAKHHVHLLFYIFKDDDVGRRVAESLIRAAHRGVWCRIAVDAFGSRSLNWSLGKHMASNGVDLHTVMPVNPFRRHLTRFDLRNHRKLVIIDGKIGYTGSQNIESQDYHHRRPRAWHDIMVRMTGPAVLQMQLVFAEDWYFAAGRLLEDEEIFPMPDAEGDIPAQVLPSGPTDPTSVLRDLLIDVIFDARERIIITSPYFIPDEPLMVALHMAALRGATIDLIIPRHTDHPVIGAVARAYIDDLVRSGVNVYFHRGILHAKTMSVDDALAVIGTANFDRRSFFLHSELSLLLYGADVVGQLREKQIQYISQSHPLDFERWRNRSSVRLLRDRTVKLLSPLL